MSTRNAHCNYFCKFIIWYANNVTDYWLIIAREQHDNGAGVFDSISGDVGFLPEVTKIPPVAT